MARRGPTPLRKGHSRALTNAEAGLLSRVLEIVEAARGHAVRSVNSAMVHAYWLIGREIVEVEQGGERRAGYGDEVIQRLAEGLVSRLGKGFGERTLRRLRQFYLTYPKGSLLPAELGGPAIRTAALSKSKGRGIRTAVLSRSKGRQLRVAAPGAVAPVAVAFPPNLGWTHYLVLLKVTNDDARAFYEIEAAREGLKLVPAAWPRAGEGAAA